MANVSSQEGTASDPHSVEQHERCAQMCFDCFWVCSETLQKCLKRGGEHVEAGRIRTLQDCIDICGTSANFLLRNSPLHLFTCKACAEVCGRCAEDCERMGDDKEMVACAESCRRCEDSCRQMSAH